VPREALLSSIFRLISVLHPKLHCSKYGCINKLN
jgi:hypothetical protein